MAADIARARKLSFDELRSDWAVMAEMMRHGAAFRSVAIDDTNGPPVLRLIVQPDADVIVKIASAQIGNADLPAQLHKLVSAMIARLSSAQRDIDAVRRTVGCFFGAGVAVSGIGATLAAPDLLHRALLLAAILGFAAGLHRLRGRIIPFLLQRTLLAGRAMDD